MVLWLHTSSQTKPNLLQIWAEEAKVQQAHQRVGGGLRAALFMLCSTFHFFYITKVQSEPSPFRLCSLSVHYSFFFYFYFGKKQKTAKNLGFSQGSNIIFFSTKFLFFFQQFYFPFVVESSPNPSAVSSRMWFQLNTHVDFHIEAHKRWTPAIYITFT